jgi:hypothetical protein
MQAIVEHIIVCAFQAKILKIMLSQIVTVCVRLSSLEVTRGFRINSTFFARKFVSFLKTDKSVSFKFLIKR